MKSPKAKNSKDKTTLDRIKDAAKRKRQSKIDKLHSSPKLWKNLEHTDTPDNVLLEDINRFTNKFRQYYQSGKTMRFRDWLSTIEDLLDTLD